MKTVNIVLNEKYTNISSLIDITLNKDYTVQNNGIQDVSLAILTGEVPNESSMYYMLKPGKELTINLSEGNILWARTAISKSTICITGDIATESFTYTITPTPSNATVTINGTVGASAKVAAGAAINWKVEAVGYETKTGTDAIFENKTVPVTLEKAKVTFTVNAIPTNAVVKLNSEIQNSITVDYGSTVNYEVSLDGYVTQSGTTEALTKNTSINITLVEEPKEYTLTINPTPSDATVKINNTEQKTITVTEGTKVTWSVEKTGYTSQSGEETMNDNKELNITLVAIPTFTFTITPTPESATVKLNGETKNSITVETGTEVNWEVSATGYDTQTGEETITANKTLPVTLVKTQVTVTATTNPADATVTMNDVPGNPQTFDYGTEVTVKATKTGYLDASQNLGSVTSNVTPNLVLTPDSFTLTINPTPSDATVTLNDEVRTSITGTHDTNVNWKVEKAGYVTKSGTEQIGTSNRTLDIELEAEPTPQYTLTINPTPAEATVKLNSVEQKSITVDSGTSVAWEVSMTGYTTQSGNETVTETKTLDIVLTAESA